GKYEDVIRLYMQTGGLVEVLNPSEAFLSERGNQNSGSIVTSTIEGSRPILIEVQALVSPSNYGNPQRVATGFDYKRLSILLAVLEKRASYMLSAANVFVNIAGGVKIDEPAADLAVCCSIVSSFLDKPADNSCIAIGEVGLGGEIRSISHIEKRLQEAEKLGFKRAIIPQNAAAKLRSNGGIKIIGAENIKDALDQLF
ncbi:MAG TPA: magnesium chelatase domain-containing protein, partial [Ignavibacteriales bacterium]|nr:magnesium chelatase domain-containing protein [Ignavibacteriales bacterium]